MTLVEIHKRAQLNRDCGLPVDADMIDALADVVEAATKSFPCDHRAPAYATGICPLCTALARVEALKP